MPIAMGSVRALPTPESPPSSTPSAKSAGEALENPDGPAGVRATARETITAFADQVDERAAKMRRILTQREEFARELRSGA
jgi:hypothetical protein